MDYRTIETAAWFHWLNFASIIITVMMFAGAASMRLLRIIRGTNYRIRLSRSISPRVIEVASTSFDLAWQGALLMTIMGVIICLCVDRSLILQLVPVMALGGGVLFGIAGLLSA